MSSGSNVQGLGQGFSCVGFWDNTPTIENQKKKNMETGIIQRCW